MSESLFSLFDMGKYGFYVWGSYAIAAIVLAIALVGPALRLRVLREQLKQAIEFEIREEKEAR